MQEMGKKLSRTQNEVGSERKMATPTTLTQTAKTLKWYGWGENKKGTFVNEQFITFFCLD
jgi:hypothetical protein